MSINQLYERSNNKLIGQRMFKTDIVDQELKSGGKSNRYPTRSQNIEFDKQYGIEDENPMSQIDENSEMPIRGHNNTTGFETLDSKFSTVKQDLEDFNASSFKSKDGKK